MQDYINRRLEKRILQYMNVFPVTAIIGPRQCGKSSTIKYMAGKFPDFVYLDLENYEERKKLDDPELFFRNHPTETICIDEIQNRPELFSPLRSIIDRNRKNGRFIVLGSASPALLRQGSQTLAGRIGYLELTPFTLAEIRHLSSLENNWLKGGYPNSILSSGEESLMWRSAFIRSFIERDIPLFGLSVSPNNLNRLLSMCAHLHGQLINFSKVGESLGISYHTVQSYIDILNNFFILRTLSPYYTNIKKRLVKSPKIYFRDSGILHALLGIKTFNDLMGHPTFGASWEGFALENILAEFTDWQPYFYRTATGVEIDLILVKGLRKVAIELKASTNPQLGKGFYIALDDLNIDEAWIIAPIDDVYSIHPKVKIAGLWQFITHFES